MHVNQTKNPVFKQFVEGFSLPLKACKILIKYKGLKRVAILPLLVNTTLFSALIGFAIYLINLVDVPGDVTWDFWGKVGSWCAIAFNYISDFFEGFLKWLVMLPLTFIICYYVFAMVGIVIASPFNDILSERVERVICSPREAIILPFSAKIKLMILSIWDSLRIVMMQLVCTLLCLPFIFIPIVGSIPLITVTAWFTGLGYFDVSLARNNLRSRHKKKSFRLNKWRIFGLGFCMECLFMIPFLNLFFLPIAVTAGTYLYCSFDWEKYFEENGLESPVAYQAPIIRDRQGLGLCLDESVG